MLVVSNYRPLFGCRKEIDASLENIRARVRSSPSGTSQHLIGVFLCLTHDASIFYNFYKHSMTEKGPRDVSGEPQRQIPLLPELAEFLRRQEIACVMQPTTRGTAFVIKLAGREIASVAGRVPIHLRHELYSHPAAPVIRTVLTVYDQPERPLAIETFTNAEQPDQREDFARLAQQDQFLLLSMTSSSRTDSQRWCPTKMKDRWERS